MRADVMVNWLHSKQEERIWTTGAPGEGVILKVTKGQYVCCPTELRNDSSSLFDMVSLLNVRVAMTVNTRVIKLILEHNELSYVQIREGLRLQVVPDVEALPYCHKHQSAAFVAAQQYLVVWEDDPKKLLERAQFIQDSLMKLIWGKESTLPTTPGEKEPDVNEFEWESIDQDDKVEKKRPVMLIQAFLTAGTLALVLTALGTGWRNIAVEMKEDPRWIRLAFIGCIIPQFWLGLFFFQALMGNLAQCFGPTSHVRENSRFYSGKAPRRLHRDGRSNLPHVTIQMPVYKEGLQAVIEPTIRSIKAAISTYEMQGGTANILVNDDGMQIMGEEVAKARQDFYDEHNVGWVARPKHNPKPKEEGELAFFRRGKFKKASNMNYALWVSVKAEERLAGIERHEHWNQRDENLAYSEAVKTILQENNGQAWADGNIRVGDYILLIDSDTRVPEDCLLEAVSEMEQSPQVAIIQYASGVMNVTDSFFEKGITFFTNLIYTQIQFSVANGDVAPFVGHNAVLRWAAMQEIAYDCPLDKREKYWSEETVSEDFDMALRLQGAGYLVRLASYKDRGYKEGVSLTVYDELARWEKYAYGCSELIFHPLFHWPRRGPFTPLFKSFITSCIPLTSKFTIMAYVGTYYAIGSAWVLTLMNYFLIGWFNGMLDHYYLDSFKVYFSIIVIFTAMGNVALALFRYRIREAGLGEALLENLKWVPLLVIFLGGVSLHVSQALLCHMLCIDMSWGATAKEVDNTPFFKEIPRVLRRFKGTFALCFGLMTLMVTMALVMPFDWNITLFTAVFPLCAVAVTHFLLPIVLNPNLLRFTW
ncbi:hypothetical protein K458DRAFT_341123 [Lentithecium fluviatile CBS 122367]|uniref:Uncharacterized protein n=1 Tax=Lentithecium fluviatile CBS 122367 TaxID=1168545 RepID=A0A6G1IYI2_9PLEO|nr:hypothetical protein K458DRAFT_341123 [Lentithecium fluviatile CBS 122367]